MALQVLSSLQMARMIVRYLQIMSRRLFICSLRLADDYQPAYKSVALLERRGLPHARL